MKHSPTDHLGEQVPSKPARTGKTANLHSDSLLLLLLLFGEGGGDKKNNKSILRNKNNRMKHSPTDHLGEQVPSKPARIGKTSEPTQPIIFSFFGGGGIVGGWGQEAGWGGWGAGWRGEGGPPNLRLL